MNIKIARAYLNFARSPRGQSMRAQRRNPRVRASDKERAVRVARALQT